MNPWVGALKVGWLVGWLVLVGCTLWLCVRELLVVVHDGCWLLCMAAVGCCACRLLVVVHDGC